MNERVTEAIDKALAACPRYGIGNWIDVKQAREILLQQLEGFSRPPGDSPVMDYNSPDRRMSHDY